MNINEIYRDSVLGGIEASKTPSLADIHAADQAAALRNQKQLAAEEYGRWLTLPTTQAFIQRLDKLQLLEVEIAADLVHFGPEKAHVVAEHLIRYNLYKEIITYARTNHITSADSDTINTVAAINAS